LRTKHNGRLGESPVGQLSCVLEKYWSVTLIVPFACGKRLFLGIQYGMIIKLFALHYILLQNARSTVQTEQAMIYYGHGAGSHSDSRLPLRTSAGQLYVPQVFFYTFSGTVFSQ
jgi:hypothetical protein